MPTFINLTRLIDKIANEVESKGFLKEAYSLDVISNTLERFAAINPGPVKDAPNFQEIKSFVQDVWKKENMDQFIQNQKSRDKVLLILYLLGVKDPNKLKSSIKDYLVEIHDIAVNNQLNNFDAFTNDLTTESFEESLRILKQKRGGLGGDLTKEEEEQFLRVKTLKDFGGGWKWVYAVDQKGEPVGFLPSRLCNKTMGHCGNQPSVSEGDVYYELRQGNKPYLTLILDAEGKIKESKGAFNQIPKNKKELLPMVRWFMERPEVKGVSYDKGYARDRNFGIVQFMEDDPAFIEWTEKNKPGLIHKEVDRPILEWKRKLKSGEVTEQDVIEAFEKKSLQLEHIRGILGKMPFTEDALISYINSGKLNALEIGNADTRYLTDKVQDALIEKDESAIKILVEIYSNVPNSNIRIDKIIKKKPEAIYDFPKNEWMEVVNKIPESFAEVFKKNPKFIKVFPEDERMEIFNRMPEAFAEVFKKNPDAIYYFTEDERMEIFNRMPEAFAKVFKKNPDAIYYFTEDERMNIFNRMPEAFAEVFKKKPDAIRSFPKNLRIEIVNKIPGAFAEVFKKNPWAIDYFPEDERMGIFNKMLEAFAEGFKKKPGAIRSFPKNLRIEIVNKIPGAFAEGFKEDPSAIQYFPEDERMNIFNKMPESFAEVFKNYPWAIGYFPRNEQMGIFNKMPESFAEGFKEDPSAIQYFPEDERMGIFNKMLEAFAEGFKKKPGAIRSFPKNLRIEIVNKIPGAFAEGFKEDPKAIQYFPENVRMNIFNKMPESFAEGFKTYPWAIGYFPKDQQEYIKNKISEINNR